MLELHLESLGLAQTQARMVKMFQEAVVNEVRQFGRFLAERFERREPLREGQLKVQAGVKEVSNKRVRCGRSFHRYQYL